MDETEIKSKKSTQFLAAITAAGYAYIYGTMLAWTNPVETRALDGDLGFKITHEEFSWIGAIISLGAVVSCIPTGFFIDIIGRKLGMLLLVIPLSISWGLILFATNSWMLICARAIQGLSIGAICVTIPMYTSEISQKEIRGMLSALFHLLLILGILMVFVVGAFVKPLTLSIICATFPILLTICVFFIPETPLFLIRKNKVEKAEKAYRWLRGKNYDPTPEILNVQEAITKSHIERKKASFGKGNANRGCINALLICLALMFFQQFSGIKIVIFYSTQIFSFGGSQLEPKYCTIIIGVVQTVATLWAVAFVDKLGRRLLLLISAAFMAASLFIMGWYFFAKENNFSVGNLGWLPLTAMCVYIVMYSIGFGPVPWILLGELVPPEVKGRVGSLATTLCWISAFTVAKLYPTLLNAIGGGPTFWILTFLTTVGFFFVLFLLPETKGKTFAEIQGVLMGEK